MFWKWTFTFLGSICTFFCFAQTFAFDHLGTREGLPASQIHSFFQEQNGACWIGTEIGVSRYDGFYFDHFFNASNTRLGKINQLVADQSEGFWLAGPNGLFYFQEDELIATPYVGRPWTINALQADQKGGLWLGCLDGIYYVPPSQVDSIRNGLSPNFIPKQEIKEWFSESFEDPRIQALELTDDGRLFIATNFIIFEYSNNCLIPVWGQQNQKEDIRDLHITNGQLYWACKSGFYTLKDTEIIFLGEISGLGKAIFNHPSGLIFCSSDALYLFENDHGLRKIIDAGAFELIQINTAASDREQNIWIGSWEGLLKASPSIFQKQTENIPPIFGFGLNDKGNILFGTIRGRGYSRIGFENKLLLHGEAAGIKTAEITSFLAIDSTELWATTGYEGILQIKAGKKSTLFNTEDGIGDDAHFFIHLDQTGRIFAGGDGGITQIIRTPDSDKIEFRRYNYQTPKGDYIVLNSCIEPSPGILFFGSNQGIFYLDETSNLSPVKLDHFPAYEPDISRLHLASNEFAFAATKGNGILSFHFENGQIETRADWNQPAIINELIWLDICSDDFGNLWAGSYRQLCKIPIDKEDKTCVCFDEKDGFFSASYPNLHLKKDENGIIYAGCSNGIVQFNPSKLNAVETKPNIYLREVFHLYENRSLYNWKDQNNKTDIILNPGQHGLKFSFSNFSYRNNSKSTFKYRLTPFDLEWQTTTGNSEAIYSKISAGNYQFEVISGSINTIEKSQGAVFNFEILPPFYQSNWFWLLCFVLVILAIWQIYRWQNIRKEKERKLLALKQRMTETRLMAIRAQMNPHFIFNSLNSIQECILSQKVDTAYHYLSTFSRLLRLVLDYSSRNYIRLDQEIHLLGLYLDLEKMRFDEQFIYHINHDPNLDLDAIRLPSLLIQPFVENAIWHGLLPKEGHRNLLIEFQEDGDDFLICTVTDNGIGRAASQTRKASQIPTEKHESKGMKLALERIEAVSQQTGLPATIEVIDLYNEAKTPSGTKVIIRLPAT